MERADDGHKLCAFRSSTSPCLRRGCVGCCSTCDVCAGRGPTDSAQIAGMEKDSPIGARCGGTGRLLYFSSAYDIFPVYDLFASVTCDFHPQVVGLFPTAFFFVADACQLNFHLHASRIMMKLLSSSGLWSSLRHDVVKAAARTGWFSGAKLWRQRVNYAAL